MELKNKRALIVGGTGGIGSAIALELARAGVDVVISARRDTADASAILSQLRAANRRAEFVAANAVIPDDVERLVRDTVDLLGGLEIVVHGPGGSQPGRLSELSHRDWASAIDVHLNSAFYVAQSVLPHLRAAGGGTLTFISSAAAQRAPADGIAYSTAKAAVIQFARCLARDAASDKIRVNCVLPGFVDTTFHEHMSDTQRRELDEERIPVGRMGRSDEIAQLVRAIISNDYITGEAVRIDGGINLNFR